MFETWRALFRVLYNDQLDFKTYVLSPNGCHGQDAGVPPKDWNVSDLFVMMPSHYLLIIGNMWSEKVQLWSIPMGWQHRKKS